MALNNHVEKFTLDMAPGGIAPVLNVSQGDIGRTFTADMYWAGTSYDVSGLTVRLRGRKRDNTVFDYALSAPSGSEVTFETQEQMTIIPGNVECELVFTDSNSRVVGTANFVFIVEESPYDPNAISESEVTGLVDLISDQIGGAVDDWMETEAPTSPEFAAAMQDATDAYLDEHGVSISYEDITDAPDFATINVHVNDLSSLATWENGKYVVPTTGAVENNSTFSASDALPVTGGKPYTIKAHAQVYCAWYDTNGDYISGLTYNRTIVWEEVVTAPANATTIRVSCVTANISEFAFFAGVEYEKVVTSDIYVNASNVVPATNIIDVKPNGGGDFTTLKAAFESITDSSKTNRYEVRFYGNGTEYDVTQEFTSTSGTVGLLVPPFTRLVGVGGKQKNILVARLSAISNTFSPINLYQTSELKGFKVIGNNTRYAVHDDFVRADEVGNERTIEDVEAISEKTYYFRAWGAGCRSGVTWNFKNCIFGGNQSENEGSFSCHNNTGFTEPARLVFDNCRCLTSWTNGSITWGIRMSSIVNDANGVINTIELKGTKTSGLFFTEENAGTYGKGMLWAATGYANDTTTATISVSDGNNYASRIDLI